MAKIFGPYARQCESFEGYDLSYTQAHLDLMAELIDQIKGYGKLKLRKSRTKGTWYTEIVDERNGGAEIQVRKEPEEKPVRGPDPDELFPC